MSTHDTANGSPVPTSASEHASLSFADLMTQLGGSDGAPATTSAPARVARPVPAPRSAFAPSVAHGNVVADVEALVGELRRDVAKQTGLIGLIKTKIRGDELQRRQLATLGRRIDAVSFSEETKVVLFLAISARTVALRAATDAMAEMHAHVGRFEPGTPAHELGWRMIEHNMDDLITLADQITQRGIQRTLRPVGLDR